MLFRHLQCLVSRSITKYDAMLCWWISSAHTECGYVAKLLNTAVPPVITARVNVGLR